MSVIVRTEALCLRVSPMTETSRVVSWITPDHGRIATLIKGSQRPKSPFLGRYDLFQTCELLFYLNERNAVYIARECTPLAPRDAFRRDWRACAAASYACDLAARIVPPHAPARAVCAALTTALDHLAAGGIPAPTLYWFELRVLGGLGLAPRLDRCLDCEAALLPATRPVHFAVRRGGFLCHRCAEPGDGALERVAADSLEVLLAWQRAESPPTRPAPAPRHLGAARHLLGLFLRHHLDLPLESRDLALGAVFLRPFTRPSPTGAGEEKAAGLAPGGW